MENRIRYKLLMVFAFSILYAGTYRFFQSSGLYHEVISFNPWLFYPAAFVRLAAFLVIGFWCIPALFLAGFCCIDFGMQPAGIVLVSAFCAVGGPLGVDLTSKMISLKPSLENLNASRLLLLALGCAIGNALFLKLGLYFAAHETSKMPDYVSIVIGDTIGTWVMIYIIKFGLTLYGRTLRS